MYATSEELQVVSASGQGNNDGRHVCTWTHDQLDSQPDVAVGM
jgi:hypothetical protein